MIDLVLVETLGRVMVCPPFGVEVVVAVVEKTLQFEPLADEAGQPHYRQVEPAPQLAVEGVAVFMKEHSAGIVAGIMLEGGLNLHRQPHLHKAAHRHARIGVFFAMAANDIGDASEGVHPVHIATEDP